MKKIYVCTVAVIVMTMVLCGCGSNTATSEPSAEPATVEQTDSLLSPDETIEIFNAQMNGLGNWVYNGVDDVYEYTPSMDWANEVGYIYETKKNMDDYILFVECIAELSEAYSIDIAVKNPVDSELMLIGVSNGEVVYDFMTEQPHTKK